MLGSANKMLTAWMLQGFNISESQADIYSNITTNEVIFSLVSDALMLNFLWTVTLLFQIISAFGLGANIINIICFVRLGFKDPVNISLIGLGVSDLGSLSALIWISICCSPGFAAADLPFDPVEFQYLTGCVPHTTFTRVTAWITALITLERCLCITSPLKVKQIITSKRVTALIISVFVALMASVAPAYVVNRIGLKFFAYKNKTLLGLLYREDREIVEGVSYTINNNLVPFIAFSIIIVCTVTLVFQLKKKTEWRMKSTCSAQGDSVSSRNQKVAKMILMISSLFMICFVPVSVLGIAVVLVPGLSLSGQLRDILTLSAALGFVLESINSSVNIFIYYHMSSKFRAVFLDLLCKC